MMKKIVLFFMLFFLFTQYNYGQENKIKISPSNLLGTSSILLTVEDRGSYSLTIKNKTGEKIFIKKFEIFEKKFEFFVKGPPILFIIEKAVSIKIHLYKKLNTYNFYNLYIFIHNN